MTVECVILGPGEGRTFWTSLSDARVKIESGVADFSVFESSPPPAAPGPPPHVHHSYDEAWYVIAGEIEFIVGDRRERQSAGSFVFVPRGVTHSFGNPGPSEARILVIGSPRVQALVEELGRLGRNGPPDPAAVADVFRRHDSEVVPPASIG